MAFGINKKYFSFLLRPQLIYLYYKRNKYLQKFKGNTLSLGIGVSIKESKLGSFVHLGNEVSLFNTEIGNHSYVNSRTVIKHTIIGKFCSIGSNITFGLGKHPIHLISTHPAFYSNNKIFKTYADKLHFQEYEEIIIGNDVWIGSNSIVMSGVRINNGAVIAAGAIVTKDVAPYEVVGGVPAKHIKFRIDEEIIQNVNASQWWDKSEEWFTNNYSLFLNQKKFLDYFDN